MPLIRLRDVPEHIYHLLAEQARRECRSLSQQVIAVLALSVQAQVDAKARRRALLEAIRSTSPPRTRKLRDAAKLIRQDRRR
jgi:hypothetical protein